MIKDIKNLKFKVKNFKSSRAIIGGFTLAEILIVVFVFGLVGVLTTRSLALSLRGSSKSEAIADVRENVDYAINVMERQIRNAESLDCVASCGSDGCSGDVIEYNNQDGDPSSFQCANNGGDFYISANSASVNDRLTSSHINVTCGNVFTCYEGDDDIPGSVDININATATGLTGAEGFQVTSLTNIRLRTY